MYYFVFDDLVSKRKRRKAGEKQKALLLEFKPEAREFDSAQQTIVSDIKGLSTGSIQKLSKAFLEVEDELVNGCSRQLIVNTLVALNAINDEKIEQFMNNSSYMSEVL